MNRASKKKNLEKTNENQKRNSKEKEFKAQDQQEEKFETKKPRKIEKSKWILKAIRCVQKICNKDPIRKKP